MGLRYLDLMTHVTIEMAGPAPECAGCTASGREPACTKVSQKPNPNAPPNRPKPGPKPSKRMLDGLEALRSQLRYQLQSELRTS